jgi:uncharacterized protein (TIGR02099 family)
MVKKSLLWVYRAALWCAGLIAIIVILSAAAIQFLLLPNINQYKDKIAAFASTAAQQKITIGDIKADWNGINPHLNLVDISLFDAQNRPALQLKKTELTLSWLSLALFEPHLGKLSIHAPELTIRRIASGEIFVAGISMRAASKPDLANWLLRQSKLQIVDAKVVWKDEMRAAPTLSLHHLNLELSSPPWRSLLKNHRLTLSALPSVATKKPIRLIGNIYGNNISQLEQWHGDISLQLQNADLAAFKPWFDYPIDLLGGVGSTQLAVHFADSQLLSVSSDLSLKQVELKLKADADTVILQQLNGKLSWNRLSDTKLVGLSNRFKGINPVSGQVFSVDQLSLTTNNGLTIKDLVASYTDHNTGNALLSLKLAHIDLTLLKPYLAQLSLATSVSQKISQLDTTGVLTDLTLQWEGRKSATKAYQLNTKFSGLGIEAQTQSPNITVPGFSNLSGEIKASQSTGHIKLYTKNAQLDLKNVLRGIIPADKLSGDIRWNISAANTQIEVSKLVISNPHLSGTINGSYLMDGNKGGLLDLKADFAQGDAKYAALYYPTILGVDTLHWLDTSIQAGQLEDIKLRVKGRLDDFPFVDSQNKLDSKLGIFRVTAKITDGRIEYGTGWPAIEGLSTNLLFEGTRMELNATAGNILGNKLVKSKTSIAQLDADYPILNITGDLQGPVNEGIKFVNQSPVAKLTQGFTDGLKTSGTGKLSLALTIPLNDVDASQYKGSYQVKNGSIASVEIPALTQVNGQLEFNEHNLTAKNIKAYAYGAPLTLNLNSDQDKIIRVVARGKLNDEVIKQTLGKGANYLSGNTNWVGEILIQKPLVSIGVRADLFGISSSLPAPLNKAADEHLSLRFDKKLTANTDTMTVFVGNKLAVKTIRSLNNNKLQLERAAIHVNSANVSNVINPINDLSAARGLQLTGDLDYVDVDAWRKVILNLPSAQCAEATLPIKKIDVNINKLDIFERRINQLNIVNISGKTDFQAKVQSREISGDVQWLSQKNGKLIARLSNLIIPDATPNAATTATNEVIASISDFKKLHQDYPSLDITAENFEFDRKSFGRLELIAYPVNEDWSIQKLKFISPEATMSADGQWNNWVKNPNTSLNVNLDIKNLGKTLKLFGHDDMIKGGAGELTGQLSWPGSPHEFDTTRLNGNLQFDMRKGQILKVQPGVGRLLGLLSLQSLPRRLSLDFRDLFSNGFAFDKINASVKIDRGIMRSDDFKMIGPAAEVSIKGETDLQKETQRLTVRVMPHVSDSLSLAALAGGPLVGAVAFLAQKILKDPLNKIASSEYEIIGTWDNPQVIGTWDNPQEVKSSTTKSGKN